LISLLNELDETVLPRKFDLATNNGQSACLYVVRRRLIRIDRNDTKRDSGEMPPESAGTMMATLAQVFDGATKARLQITRTDCLRSGLTTGHSISALASAGSLTLKPRPDPDPVPTLFNALGDQMAAWVKLDPNGNIVGQDGDPARVTSLERVVRNSLTDMETQLAQTLPDPDQPGCMLLNLNAFGGMSVLYARSFSTGFLALLPASELANLQRCWRTFYSGI